MSLERTQTINQRISNRNVPTFALQPNINCRPVSTKYSWYPLVDLRRHVKYPLNAYPQYNNAINFYPGDAKAPVSGINVNLESELRNQIFALQKCSQAVYVPQPSSDMYQEYLNINAQSQEHAELFATEKWRSFNPNTYNMKTSGFNNSTRTDLKNL
jgi:hypothetical protein